MQTFYCDQFVLPLPDGHRFPMDKYRRLRERVAADARFDLAVPDAVTDAQLLRCHDAGYLHKIVTGGLSAAEQRVLGFPWSPQLVERSRRSTGATIAAAKAALADGAAASLAGGTHHARRAVAAGFCVFNDCAVAAHDLLAEQRARRVLIIDLDVHQGDGTAEICAGRDDIFTLSLHGANNFPVRKVTGDLDVELADGTTDAAYLESLQVALAAVEQRFEADFAFYLAGADPYQGDRLGRLALSKTGLRERDRQVIEWCRRRHLPLAMVMAGGYADEIEEIVDIHYASLTLLQESLCLTTS